MTKAHSSELPRSLAGTPSFGSRLLSPNTSVHPSPPPGGWEECPESSAPSPPASQAGAGGGSTRPREGKARPGDRRWRRSGKGAAAQQERRSPPHPRPSPYGSGTGRKKVRRSMRGAPTTGKGERTPAPHFGRKSYSQEASFADGRKNVQAPPPGQESGEGKVLSGLGPSLPGDPAGPPPPRRRRPGQVLPLPQPGAHSPARQAARLVSSRPSQRPVLLLFPLTFPGGSAAPP